MGHPCRTGSTPCAPSRPQYPHRYDPHAIRPPITVPAPGDDGECRRLTAAGRVHTIREFEKRGSCFVDASLAHGSPIVVLRVSAVVVLQIGMTVYLQRCQSCFRNCSSRGFAIRPVGWDGSRWRGRGGFRRIRVGRQAGGEYSYRAGMGCGCSEPWYEAASAQSPPSARQLLTCASCCVSMASQDRESRTSLIASFGGVPSSTMSRAAMVPARPSPPLQ